MKKLAIAALLILVVIGVGVLGALWWWNRSIDQYAAAPFGTAEEKVVEIPQGANLKEVARLLAGSSVISDETRFYWLGRRLKKDRQIKAGEYAFQGPLLPEKIFDDIAHGRVKQYHCTIAEGLRMDEIAPLLDKCGWGKTDDYLRLMHDAAFARRIGLHAQNLEGYLFPDTYSFPRNPKPEAVLQKMIARFGEEYRKADAHRLPGVTLDEHQAATLASIVEKETGAPEERPRISCVFHNRMKKGMRLETDPTAIYAKILHTGSFDGNLHREDLEFMHPYNTYKVKGLPPGPIANAGAAALEAALHPSACNDLFFVACGEGRHVFCPDFECHQKNVERCQLGKH